jgi:hypothetical protein
VADFDYSGFVNVADSLIDRFGRTVTIIKVSRDAANTAKPWRGPTSTSVDDSFDAKMVIPSEIEADADRVGAPFRRPPMKQGGPVQAFLAAKNITDKDVKTYNYVSDGDRLRTIVSVDEVRPGPTSIMFTITIEP